MTGRSGETATLTPDWRAECRENKKNAASYYESFRQPVIAELCFVRGRQVTCVCVVQE